MKIAIVILNWNGRDLLEKFLPSVVKYSLEDAEVYVADNNSTDDSISFLQNNYPQVKIIQNQINIKYHPFQSISSSFISSIHCSYSLSDKCIPIDNNIEYIPFGVNAYYFHSLF